MKKNVGFIFAMLNVFLFALICIQCTRNGNVKNPMVGSINKNDIKGNNIKNNNNNINTPTHVVDTLTGLMNDDNIIDTVYVRVESFNKNETSDGISECVEQVDKSTMRIVIGMIGVSYNIEDEEFFDYPYSGFSNLSYSIEEKGIIVRRCRSNRHSDIVHVDSYFEYDSKLKNWYKIKVVSLQKDGEGNVYSQENLIDNNQPSIDGKSHRK